MSRKQKKDNVLRYLKKDPIVTTRNLKCFNSCIYVLLVSSISLFCENWRLILSKLISKVELSKRPFKAMVQLSIIDVTLT